MRTNKKMLLCLITVMLALTFSACGRPTNKATHGEIIVSAASSLKDSMNEVKTIFDKEKTGINITYNFASSGALQKQIEQGADVDIFISAAVTQMDRLSDKGLIMQETRINLLENKLVLIIPKDSIADVTDFKDVVSSKVKKIGLGELKSVPSGQYAEEVYTKIGLLDSIKTKAVYGKDVREILTWVETGNVDGGIVYETDAKVSEKVKIVAYAPEGSHKPIIYPAAIMKGSKNQEGAKTFLNFLYSDKAKPIFEKCGFIFLAKYVK